MIRFNEWVLSFVGLCVSSVMLAACASPSEVGSAQREPTAAPVVARSAPDIPGAKRFVFERWAGPALPVWYLRPAGTPASAPIVFVMHGMKRDADRYLGEWAETAREHGFIIVVPEFTSQAFPGAAGYNFGGVFGDGGEERPRSRWTYTAIEPIFDEVRSLETLTSTQYWLFGHSAGAQFVHRYAMLGMGPRMRAAISANAGSYMFATQAVQWPFGVAGAPGGYFDFARAFVSPLVLLLGDADNDPGHPSLPHQPAADLQGPHRFARGQNFYARAREAARKAELEFQWSCVIAPGVAHDNGKMTTFAAAIITSPTAVQPGRDCFAAR